MFDRRQFCALSLSAAITSAVRASSSAQAPRILLRSSWQVVNIGDIAHTPGVLALIEKHIPGAEVRLWASGDLTDEVAEMEHRRFPHLRIVKGSIDADGQASTPELKDALEWTDFLLHGSGPSLVAQRDVAAFDKHVKKPFGVYGITYSGSSPDVVSLLSRASFVYFRDSVSLTKARDEGVACPIMEFAPDGAFACDLRNDAAAEKWLADNGLEAGKFACCIPRLRYTPYWLVRKNSALDPKKHARNNEMADRDHQPLREAIAQVVQHTDLKVLVCPEDRTQMQVGKDWIIDKLSPAVRDRVLWKDEYWLTDEALSTYVRSAGLFGLEMHSPIMAIGNGIPAIVGRFAEQTSKGFMWRDIGLDEWLFDFDVPEHSRRYPAAVVRMLTDRERSAKLVQSAQGLVHARQQSSMAALAQQIPDRKKA